jgi:predicted AAA+ superfamily ATPase
MVKNGVMYSRIITPLFGKSFFLFGPRATGKSTWARAAYPNALYIDLLAADIYTRLLARPQRLNELIPARFKEAIIIDEIQRVPELLNEVHRLIENRKLSFVMTGSSARKLREKGTNLLAGRALTRRMHPLTVGELGSDFSLDHSLRYGHLPMVYREKDPLDYLYSYVHTYMQQEVQQEGLTRNLQSFARFLETASFSQAAVLNISQVARECDVHRKVAEAYFHILEDLLVALRLPVFTRRAQRKMTAHPKFFLFDAGVFRAIRPRGVLDRPEEIDGAALETLFLQEIRSINDYHGLKYDLYYWRTPRQLEVDFVLYGPKGLLAIEIKRTRHIRPRDLRGLRAFKKDYPMARSYLFYGGEERQFRHGIELVPLDHALKRLPQILANERD